MDTYDLDIFMLVLFSQIKILCHPQIKYLQLSCTKNSQIFLDALFFLPKSQIIDTHFTTVYKQHFRIKQTFLMRSIGSF